MILPILPFEDDSPDLVFTDSNELSTASAERFVTFDNDTLFGDDYTTVGAEGCTLDCDVWCDDSSVTQTSVAL